MGNTNSHVADYERRKSCSDGGALRQKQRDKLLNFASASPSQTIGPVDITRPRPPAEDVRHLFDGHCPTSPDVIRPESPNSPINACSAVDGVAHRSVDAPPDVDVISKDSGASDCRQRYPVIFKYDNKTATDVFVGGTFNGWRPMRMSKSTKNFVGIVDLEEGVHEYKFFVDGQWLMDPSPNSLTVSRHVDGKTKAGVSDSSTDNTTVNNVIYVNKRDYDAVAALEMDDELIRGKRIDSTLVFPDTFGDLVPSMAAFRNFRLPGRSDTCGPPLLPPHLLQVILNKDTPLSCEPTLLPEPERVMLNHLYALSIRDDVMVLSSTQRYRNKYVTTLLYKPMPSSSSSGGGQQSHQAPVAPPPDIKSGA